MLSDASQLTPNQIGFLSFLAIVLGQAVRIALAKSNGRPEVGKVASTGIVLVISIGLAYIWVGMPILASFKDPAEFTAALLQQAGQVFALATLLYNVLLARVFEAAGFTPTNALNKEPIG